MSAYVDGLVAYGGTYRGAGASQAARVGARHGHRWCHLYADTEEELHAFASRLGMKRAWGQVSRRGTPHYDLTPSRRMRAVMIGAVELDRTAARSLREQLRAPASRAADPDQKER